MGKGDQGGMRESPQDGIRIDHVLETNNISKHEYEMKISTK